jgi:hypothetical protein
MLWKCLQSFTNYYTTLQVLVLKGVPSSVAAGAIVQGSDPLYRWYGLCFYF